MLLCGVGGWSLLVLALPPATAQPGKGTPAAGGTTAPAGKSSSAAGSAGNTVNRLKSLPEMKINKPLIDPAEFEKLERQLKSKNYLQVLLKGVLDGQAVQIIKDWTKWRIYELTMESRRDRLFELRQNIMRRIRGAASSLVQSNPEAARKFREVLCREVTARCTDLLDNNYYVRLNAILILGRLNILEADPVQNKPPEAYGPAADPLLRKVILAGQHVTLKIPAVNGLKYIALLADLPTKTRQEIADALIAEFRNRKAHPWYQARLAEALAAVDLQYNSQREAFIIHALTECVADKTRPPLVRAQAAMALGRAPLGSTVNVRLLIYEIADLTRALAEQYNADVQRIKSGKLANLPAYWTSSFLRIYFAFWPVHRTERIILQRRRNPGDRKPGFLEKFKNRADTKAFYDYTQSAYEKIRPIVSHVLAQKAGNYQPVSSDALNSLKSWLNSNRPASFSVQPGVLPPVRVMKAATKTPPPAAANKTTAGP